MNGCEIDFYTLSPGLRVYCRTCHVNLAVYHVQGRIKAEEVLISMKNHMDHARVMAD